MPILRVFCSIWDFAPRILGEIRGARLPIPKRQALALRDFSDRRCEQVSEGGGRNPRDPAKADRGELAVADQAFNLVGLKFEPLADGGGAEGNQIGLGVQFRLLFLGQVERPMKCVAKR